MLSLVCMEFVLPPPPLSNLSVKCSIDFSKIFHFMYKILIHKKHSPPPSSQENTPLVGPFKLRLIKRETMLISQAYWNSRWTCHNYLNLRHVYIPKKWMHSSQIWLPFCTSEMYVSANYTLIKWVFEYEAKSMTCTIVCG